MDSMDVNSTAAIITGHTRVSVALATGLKPEWPAHATAMVLFVLDLWHAIQCTPFLTDIDECAEGTDACEHHCHNNAGSYTCSCNSGFQLSDGFHCQGVFLLQTWCLSSAKLCCRYQRMRRQYCYLSVQPTVCKH